MKSFCYLGDRLNDSRGSEAAVIARTRNEWIKFRECGELLYRREFFLKMKGVIYQSCVRSAIRNGSENKMAVLRRTEKALRAMCRVKLIEKRRS